jgi:adenine-specific DNA glycosylase
MGARQVFPPALAVAPEPLRANLLAWWEAHGRHAIPWKLRPDGSRPGDGEVIDPYATWCAEVMRAVRQHSRSMAG